MVRHSRQTALPYSQSRIQAQSKSIVVRVPRIPSVSSCFCSTQFRRCTRRPHSRPPQISGCLRTSVDDETPLLYYNLPEDWHFTSDFSTCRWRPMQRRAIRHPKSLVSQRHSLRAGCASARLIMLNRHDTGLLIFRCQSLAPRRTDRDAGQQMSFSFKAHPTRHCHSFPVPDRGFS
jgi:hypothetical protein